MEIAVSLHPWLPHLEKPGCPCFPSLGVDLSQKTATPARMCVPAPAASPGSCSHDALFRVSQK